MTGIGNAGGAGTIINAMATLRGVAFGLDLRVQARVAAATRWQVRSNGARLTPARARLAVESAARVSRTPARIDITTDIPPERGLKSSSAVSVAVIRAALHHAGRRWPDAKILEHAAEAGLRSATSITGAYDDAAACLLGGLVFTDNKARRILKRTLIPPGLVALVNPGDRDLPTRQVRGTGFEPIRAMIVEAERLARQGDLRSAMLLNTACYAPLFGHTATFTTDVIRQGAWAAGLSGKGPSEIALLPRRLALRLRRRHPGSLLVALRNQRIP